MKKSIVILNSADSLFNEIRDRNFQSINQVLSRTAKELQQASEVIKQSIDYNFEKCWLYNIVAVCFYNYFYGEDKNYQMI